MNKITFDRALFKGAKLKLGSVVTSAIEFVATFDPKTAAQFGDKFSIFTRDEVPREILKSTELDFDLQNYRLVHTPKGMENMRLELASDIIYKFKVFKAGGKKKGKTAQVRVKFEAVTRSDIHPLIDHLMRVGKAEGSLECIPMSEQMTIEPPAEQKRPNRPKKVKEAEAPAAEPQTEAPAAASAGAQSEPASDWPEPNNDGTFSAENADLKKFEVEGKAAAGIYILPVKEGYAYGYAVEFSGGIGARREPITVGTIQTSEAVARKNAAEGIYRFTQQIYAQHHQPQIRDVCRQVQAWAEPFINFDAARETASVC